MRFLILIILLTGPALAFAQTQDTVSRRITLAKQMHDIRSTREQVDASITQAAQKLPADKRAAFIAATKEALNYQAIEKISIEAMAEIYTAEELEAMVTYYSKPAARSAREKDAQYRQAVYPEIIRLLDAAMMRRMTGGN